MDLRADLADQSVSFAAWTTATGAPVTVTSATGGLSLWYRRGVAGAKVAITPIGDLATLETAHTDKAILVVEGAIHRLDLPDAATAAGVLTVEWGGTATGITIDGGVANLIGQANSASDVSHWLNTAPQTPTVAGVPIVQMRNSAGSAGINAPPNFEDLAVTDTTGEVTPTAASKTGYALVATTGLGNQTANITGNLTGSVGSVTGAVGSVTGAVGSVTGAVGSVTGAVGSVTGNVVGSVASVTGDVGGKVLGGGVGTITGTGARVVDASGNAIAPAATALSNAVWTDAKAGYINAAITSRSSHDAAAVVTALGTGSGLTALATAAELAKVPKSDGTVTWNATALASINAEVDTALNTAIPGAPTADSINERVATMDGRILGTIAAGTHTAQTGDSFVYLGTNLGALGANATEAGGTGDHLTAVSGLTAGQAASLTAIEADTNELQTDWANGGRLDAILDTAAGASAGTGSRAVAFTVTTGGVALQGAFVRLYRTGSLDRTGTTGANGLLTLYCDVDATWSYTVTHALYASGSGTVVVDGNEAVAVALTALSWPASTEPDSVTVRWKVKLGVGRTTAGAGGATVYVKIKTGPGTAGIARGNRQDSDATDANGYVYFANVPVGCTLSAKLGSGGGDTNVTIPAGATSPYDAGELIGDA